ncbi:hypothetical protein GGX14DRAFT_463079, partial [Mycena pura]
MCLLPSDISPSPTGLIQYFPCELISEILILLDFRSVTFATLVCQRWYYASTHHAEIWERIEINSTDVYRPDIVRRVLERSGDQPLTLQIRLSVPDSEHEQPTMDYWALQHLMRDVVKGHLDRCYRLLIGAPQVAWPVIIEAVAGADFPILGGLYLQNIDAVARWQVQAFSSLDYDVVRPSELVFPLPKDRRVLLWEAHLQGVSLGDADYYVLKNLNIQNAMDPLVVDGRLEPRLFNHAKHLTIDGICVPALEVPSTPIELSPGILQHLVLSELVAMPDIDNDGDFVEHDCTGFFVALNTSSLLTLSIDAWELDGRIWYDLLHLLWGSTAPIFPCVYMLKLRRMDFADEEMALIAGFLNAFPALQTLCVEECSYDAWEDIIHVLELIPRLCSQLGRLIVDNSIVIFRDDPLPFRSSVIS